MINLFQYRSWALAEGYFAKAFPVISNMLISGRSLDILVKKFTPEQTDARVDALVALGEPGADVEIKFDKDPQTNLRRSRVNNKNIAVISIIGPLTKYGDLCSLGMQDYQGMINKANTSDGIDGILLLMDTPGGTVDGTNELALAIKNSKKPVGVFGDNMVASAGMWIASQAKVIVGNKNNPTEFGSIGVLMVDEDWTNVMEAGHIPKMKIIRAPQSTQKALMNALEPTPENVEKEAVNDLKGIADDFIGVVKSGRGEKLNTKLDGLFTGKMFDANTSKQNGLIDSTGTIQTALVKVAELAKEQARSQANSQAQQEGITKNANMKFPKLSALFSGEAWGKALGAFTDDEKPLEAAEQKVATMEADLAKATTEKTAAETRASASEAKVTELNAQVTSLTSEKAALEGEKKTLEEKLAATPTSSSTTVISGNQEEKEANDGADKKESKFRSKADEEADRAVAAMYPTQKK